MRVIICGAGIAGLTLAWWLRQSGWDVLLVDDADGPRGDDHMVHLTRPGYDVIARMGLIAELRSIEHHIPEITYVRRDGQPRGRLRRPAFEATLDRREATVMRGDLEQVLRTALNGLVTIEFGTTVRVVRQTADEVGVVLSDGTRERADLLVGADGLRSRIRRLVFGPEDLILRPLGYETAAYKFKDDAIDREIDGRFTVLSAPGRQACIYPLGDGLLATSLAHQTVDRPLRGNASTLLHEVYGDMGWIIHDVVSHCPAMPLHNQVAHVDLDRWSRGRVTLVGDAGLAVSSLTGWNTPLAMASAFALTVALYEQHDLRTALNSYETAMRPAVQRHQSIARKAAKWVVPRHQWQITTRDALVAAAGLPSLSRLLRPVMTRASKSIAPL
ncbi:FAD-dependent oxidoreductase [Kibdelosporangium aridum]|uniref:FAD-dependent oxidoreductase n=1 Tax=Kibdelosporangium aridum TaxID=2030 RepID=A0A428ZB44_KIBAR|nr:FAD-dependent oxidoreductase [Kibdelosporangium aridum]RSM85251.1 FAD-dependent oxidoreductase [Kibdelosporangium aridum]